MGFGLGDDHLRFGGSYRVEGFGLWGYVRMGGSEFGVQRLRVSTLAQRQVRTTATLWSTSLAWGSGFAP